MHPEPAPVDLSGEIKRFVVDHDNRIAIRAMTRGDLPDVARRRAGDHVRRGFAPGERKGFVFAHDTRIAIRGMTRGALPDVARWRAADHVRRWFATGEPTLAMV